MANDEINVPSLVLILVVSGFLIRHIFFRNTSSSSSATGDRGSFEAGAAGQHGQSRDQRRAEALDRRTEAAVEHVQQIFPYADRREVWWDLRRNGLNVAATTERILAGRLETPPITFQPPAPPVRPSAAGNRNSAGGAAAGGAAGTAAGSGIGAAAASASKSNQPNLIQRYNLENKVVEAPVADTAVASSSSTTASPAASGAKTKSWSTNKDERQALLKKRRDDMILEARRKMEAKIAAEKMAVAGGATSS